MGGADREFLVASVLPYGFAISFYIIYSKERPAFAQYSFVEPIGKKMTMKTIPFRECKNAETQRGGKRTRFCASVFLCVCVYLILFPSFPARADEGMWMLGNLDKGTRRTLKEMGLELSPKELYHPKKASLKDAVVRFGRFCSGGE